MTPDICDPLQVLESFKLNILQERTQLWPPVLAAMPTVQVDSEGQCTDQQGIIRVYIEGVAPVTVFLTEPCTIGELHMAESVFRPEIRQYLACASEGSQVPDDFRVHSGASGISSGA